MNEKLFCLTVVIRFIKNGVENQFDASTFSMLFDDR